MFSKKCQHCSSKIDRSYNFCPSCGKNVQTNFEKEDYGILGKSDNVEEVIPFNDSFIDKIMNNALKIMEKQMKNIHDDMRNQKQPSNQNLPGLNIQFFVNGKRLLQDNKKSEMKPIQIKNNLPEEKLRMFAKLPKKEPVSRMRRISGKIVYEINVPGVKNIEDILINRLENSIEIKAIADDIVYFKNLNINLPITNLQLINENILIEMVSK